jgi:tetratricopeptide (TPR) repeat protein
MMRFRWRWVRALLLVPALWTLGCAALNPLQTKASRALDRGQPQLAYDLMRADLEEHPDDVHTLRLFARAASSLGEDEAALDALARAEKTGKERGALAETRQGIWRAAVQPARDFLDTLDRASDLDRERALAATARARRFDPGASGSAAIEAVIRLHEGRASAADSLFATLADTARIDARTRDVVVSSILTGSTFESSRGHFGSAVELARAAVALSADDTRPLYELGVALHRAGEAASDTTSLHEAATTFGLVLERLPDDVNARYNLALSLYRLGRFTDSESEILRLLSESPVQGHAHHLLARLRLQRGDRVASRVPLAATRAIDGTELDVPASVLDVSKTAGKEAQKRFVFDGPPSRIFSYVEKSGAVMEVWFYTNPSRVVVCSGGRIIGDEWFRGPEARSNHAGS